MLVCLYACLYVLQITGTNKHTHTDIHTDIYIYMYMYVCVHMSICIFICIYIYVHVYVTRGFPLHLPRKVTTMCENAHGTTTRAQSLEAPAADTQIQRACAVEMHVDDFKRYEYAVNSNEISRSRPPASAI